MRDLKTNEIIVHQEGKVTVILEKGNDSGSYLVFENGSEVNQFSYAELPENSDDRTRGQAWNSAKELTEHLNQTDCKACEGTGKIFQKFDSFHLIVDNYCRTCGGSGKMQQ